jgi:hypothetical protein
VRVAHWKPLPHPFHADSRPGAGTAGATVAVGVAEGVADAEGDGVALGVGEGEACSDPLLHALSSRTGSSRAAARRGRRVEGRTVAFSQCDRRVAWHLGRAAPLPPPQGGVSAVSTQTGQQSDFGANEWYIQELYQDYLKDPDSVPETWRAFLADYHPVTAPPTTNGGASAAAPAPAAPTTSPAASPAPR